jgi:adenylate cyclase
VLFSDIIGFSRFAEHISARELIDLVNSHIEVCTHWVSRFGGEVNKLTGDGVLAYFSGRKSDAAIEASLGIIEEMGQRRLRSAADSPHRCLYGGVGLADGLVYEGNIGVKLKLDFTILGNKVNLASRLEGLTRELNVRLAVDASVKRRAEVDWPFQSLGRKDLKGQSKPVEVFTLDSLPRLDLDEVYSKIDHHIRRC